MPEITDVSKLRPELLQKSYNELERMKAEIEMALSAKQKEEEERKRAVLIEEIGTRMDRVVDDLRWLYSNSALSENIASVFMARAKGKGDEMVFAPHLRFKKPQR